MSEKCPKCGTELGDNWQGPCPKCGYSESVGKVPTAYSGTVVLTGSTFSAFNSIMKVKQMLASSANYYKDGLPFIEPIIKQLDTTAEIIKKNEAELLQKQQTNLTEYQKRIEEYRELVNKKADEPLFQDFFERNPVFLSPLVAEVFPKKSLGGEKYPDFVLVLNNKNNILVEIEKPNVSLYNRKGDPTAELTHGEEQVRGYLRLAIEEKEWLRKRDLKNLTADNTRGMLVIGSDLTDEEQKKLDTHNNATRGMYSIKTFSDVLRENEAILKNLRGSTK